MTKNLGDFDSKDFAKVGRDANSYYVLNTKSNKVMKCNLQSSDGWYDTVQFLQSGQRLPDDYIFPNIFYAGSNSKTIHDMWGYLISERMANIVRQYGGPDVKLFPVKTEPNPEAKFKIRQPYYLIDVPVISCLHYEYGDELPTTEDWRKSQWKMHEEIKKAQYSWPEPPKTNKPLLKIWLNLEKANNTPLFRSKEYPSTIFASKYFIHICKKAKLIGLMYDYSANEELEGVRKAANSYLGLGYLKYDKRSI